MGRAIQEDQWTWLLEMEFAERAHVLKMLARELGQEAEPAMTELAAHGLDAALEVLALTAGASVADAYLHQRALWRAGQSMG
jgi:hypothetical protein